MWGTDCHRSPKCLASAQARPLCSARIQLESACRVSMPWGAVTVPQSAFQRVSGGRQGGFSSSLCSDILFPYKSPSPRPHPDPTQHPETEPKRTRKGAKRSQTELKRSPTQRTLDTKITIPPKNVVIYYPTTESLHVVICYILTVWGLLNHYISPIPEIVIQYLEPGKLLHPIRLIKHVHEAR